MFYVGGHLSSFEQDFDIGVDEILWEMFEEVFEGGYLIEILVVWYLRDGFCFEHEDDLILGLLLSFLYYGFCAGVGAEGLNHE